MNRILIHKFIFFPIIATTNWQDATLSSENKALALAASPLHSTIPALTACVSLRRSQTIDASHKHEQYEFIYKVASPVKSIYMNLCIDLSFIIPFQTKNKCVQKFDVTDTAQIFFKTKRSLSYTTQRPKIISHGLSPVSMLVSWRISWH